MRFLANFGLDATTTCRLNVFRRSQHAEPIDAVALAKGLIENFSVTDLELYRCGLTTEGANALSQALAVNKYIQTLSLVRNNCGAHGGAAIAEAMKVNQTVRSLDMAWTGVGDDAAASLAEALLMNQSLKRLSLDRNGISCDGAGALATALTANHKLRTLSLSMNRIKAAGCSLLGASAAMSRSLTAIDLSMNGISQVGMFSFFHALQQAHGASSLQSINVAHNNIGDAVALVGRYVGRTACLRELNLENTQLAGNAAFCVFANEVCGNSHLASLNVGCNDVGVAGIEALASAGQRAAANGKHTSLRLVDFDDCRLESGALTALASFVAAAPQLSALHMSQNPLGADAGAALAHVCASGKLRVLTAGRCRLGRKGVETFAAGLHYTTLSLTLLSLRGNDCGDAGFAAVVPLLLHQRTFEFVDFADNELTAASVAKLNDVFEANPKLPYVVLGDTTVISPSNVYLPWEQQHGQQPAPADSPIPPLCDAPDDVDPYTLAPSANFASFSAAAGSAVKRHCESRDGPHSVLFHHAGKPVKHVRTWKPNAHAKAVPSALGRFTNQVSSASTVQVENNLGRLLVTDDQLRREFNRLDVDGNGYLSVAEMRSIYKTLEHYGVEHTDRDVEHLVACYGDGKRVDFDQFCVMYLKLVQA